MNWIYPELAEGRIWIRKCRLPSTRARLPLPHNNRTIGADNRESPTIQLLDCHNICPLEGVYHI